MKAPRKPASNNPDVVAFEVLVPPRMSPATTPTSRSDAP